MATKSKPQKKISKLLVANRGEIACRIFSACKALGIKTVAVYSEADTNALHVSMADESVCIGPGPATESYLQILKIIDAAKKTGANAIHPGYGFLSEREAFAEAVLKSKLIWIGPRPEVIALLGNKIAAKKAAEKAKVSTLAWELLKDGWTEKDLLSAAKKIGFPLLLKAAAGGGGRGMRLVEKEAELKEKAESAVREAQGAFGSGEIFLEKYCARARHIEVQVFGDLYGSVVSFGERDCSIQRRHQKVIEEAPAVGLKDETRALLWKSAVNLAKSVGYENAGTCEFLVDEKQKIYFLEMNTRLQVEHPVTELVWGTDLVSLQIKTAEGEELPLELKDLKPRGHAIEARVYAEDPAKGFFPTPGKLERYKLPPSSAGLRIDTGYFEGAEVPLFYDAMLAKVITWGANRDEARRKLLSALEQTSIEGVKWNGSYLADILESKEFKEASIYTGFLGEKWKNWLKAQSEVGKKIEKGSGRLEKNITTASASKTVSPWIFFGDSLSQSPLKSKKKVEQDYNHQDLTRSTTNGPIVSQYPGKVLKVHVKVGQKVKEGQVLVVCESMKMEFSYPAPLETIVRRVHVSEGQIIPANTLLVEFSA